MRWLGTILTVCVGGSVFAAEPAALRGQKALEGTAFVRAFWPTSAYDNAWKQWGVKIKPADYSAAFAERSAWTSASAVAGCAASTCSTTSRLATSPHGWPPRPSATTARQVPSTVAATTAPSTFVA